MPDLLGHLKPVISSVMPDVLGHLEKFPFCLSFFRQRWWLTFNTQGGEMDAYSAIQLVRESLPVMFP